MIRNLATYCGAAIALVAIGIATAGPLTTERINVNPTTGAQADGSSSSPVLSSDGCVVAFISQSSTLAPASYGLTTGSPSQVYAVNRCMTPHTLELISVTNDGSAAANNACQYPNISADGRYVSFVTTAGNLPVPGSAPAGQGWFVFIRDRVANTTISPLEAWRVTSQNIAGLSETNLLHHYMSGDATRMALGFYNSISVPSDLYMVSIAGGAGTLHAVCPAAAQTSSVPCRQPGISGDGGTVIVDTSYPMVASDVNGHADVFSYGIATAASTLISVNADGTQANSDVYPYGDVAVSDHGAFVAFSTTGVTNLTGNTMNAILVKNVASGDLTLASATNDGTPESINSGTALPSLSADGSRIVFTSDNPDLSLSPPGSSAPKDALVRDMTLGHLATACISASGSHGNNGCDGIEISADGKWAAFRSISNNLVPNDTNNLPDIFVVSLDPAIDDVFTNGFEP
jgi:Tol biopolymer transport system component